MFVINRGGCFYPLVNKYNIFYFFSEDLRMRISEAVREIFLKSALSIGCSRGYV